MKIIHFCAITYVAYVFDAGTRRDRFQLCVLSYVNQSVYYYGIFELIERDSVASCVCIYKQKKG